MANRSRCDWCDSTSSSIQTKPERNIYLCPRCCPDTDPHDVPENAPYSWNFMSEEEQEAWENGMDIDEIREEFGWPRYPIEDIS